MFGELLAYSVHASTKQSQATAETGSSPTNLWSGWIVKKLRVADPLQLQGNHLSRAWSITSNFSAQQSVVLGGGIAALTLAEQYVWSAPMQKTVVDILGFHTQIAALTLVLAFGATCALALPFRSRTMHRTLPKQPTLQERILKKDKISAGELLNQIFPRRYANISPEANKVIGEYQDFDGGKWTLAYSDFSDRDHPFVLSIANKPDTRFKLTRNEGLRLIS